jgi:hypothetical protein
MRRRSGRNLGCHLKRLFDRSTLLSRTYGDDISIFNDAISKMAARKGSDNSSLSFRYNLRMREKIFYTIHNLKEGI